MATSLFAPLNPSDPNYLYTQLVISASRMDSLVESLSLDIHTKTTLLSHTNETRECANALKSQLLELSVVDFRDFRGNSFLTTMKLVAQIMQASKEPLDFNKFTQVLMKDNALFTTPTQVLKKSPSV